MDQNSKNSSDKSPKTIAVDTGKKVDLGEIKPPPRTMRRRPEDRKPKKAPPKKPDEKKSEPALAKEPPVKEVVEAPKKIAEPVRQNLDIETVEFDDSGDFAAMLEESGSVVKTESYKVGDKVSGAVVHIGKDNTFIALGPKLEAAIASTELQSDDGTMSVSLGDTITAYVISTHGGVAVSKNVAQSGLDITMLEDAAAKKIPVEGKVLALNKGGFEVQVSGRRAFCPVGQIDDKFVEDTSSFINKTLAFLVERVEEGGRNIVVTRRALLERERQEKAQDTVKSLEIGKKFEGVITRVADFGAFVDIGGLEGLIPRSEISYGRIDKVSDAVSSGDRVEVEVLSFDINQDNLLKSRLSFSLKKTKADPYTLYWDKIKANQTLEGRVVRLESFGAFIELFPGIDGLIHISELSENRVAHPKEILSIGDPVTVRIISVDDEEKRISLSLRESVARKKGQEDGQEKLTRGQKTTGIVSRIERYGVFLELDNGATALLPQSETGLPKFSELSKAFNIGDKLEVAVIDIDAQNRIRVSSLARKQMDERDSYLSFQNKENARAGGFGTFADLIKKRS